ncbi:MAG: RNA methyltransferase [Thermoanaerobaculia bacterium]
MGSDKIEEKLKIVIIEPRFSINLGLILRAMANFGFKNLILIKPRCKINSERAKQFSMKGGELFKDIKIYDSLKNLKEKGFYLMGTTRISGRYRSKRYSPEEAREILKVHPSPALVFGNEERGLNREELRIVDGLSTIKTSEGEKGSLNLAIAVSLYLYEFSKKREEEEIADSEKIRFFYNFLIEQLKKRGILKENHYKHPETTLMDIIMRAKIKEKEIGFLFYLARKVFK